MCECMYVCVSVDDVFEVYMTHFVAVSFPKFQLVCNWLSLSLSLALSGSLGTCM